MVAAAVRGLIVSALLLGAPVAVTLVLSAVGLWQGRRGARIAGFLVGVVLVVYGLDVLGAGSSGLELPAGLVIMVLPASRPARRWVRRT